MRKILGPQFQVNDLAEHPEIPHIAETGKTFEDNAILKAVTVSKHTHGFVVADDSGLEVYALGGVPGIYSARYAGPDASDNEKIERLLQQLGRDAAANEPGRAQFRC